MDVIGTASTVNIAEKKKTKKQKYKERKRNKKLMNQTNQNGEISSNGTCHGIAEADSSVGPALDVEESLQVDRARAEKVTEKKTMSAKSNKRSKKKCMIRTNQNDEISFNEKCDAIAKSSSYVGSAVESLLRGSSREDRASNDSLENKRTAFKDELVLELSKEERVLGDAVKVNSHNETKKRKRKSKRRGPSKNKLELMDQEHEELGISKNGKNCIRSESSEIGLGVDVISLVKESPKVDNFPTNIDKEKSQLSEKRKRCNSKSQARNKDGQVICDQENKCLEICIDGKRCVSADESGIDRLTLTVNPLLHESAELSEVSTEIIEEKMITEGRRKRKKKSKARNRDVKVIFDEEDKGLKISVDSKSCTAAAESGINGVDSVESLLQESLRVEELSTEIAKEKKTPKRKQKRKKKAKIREKDGNTDLDKENKCLEISVDRRSCISVPDSCIKDEDLNVEPLLKESPEVEKVATDIVNKQMTPEEKQRRKIESYYRDNNVKVILGEEDKCLKISGDRKRCIAASDIVNNWNTPEEKQRRKIESYYRDSNVQVILREKDKCPKISADKRNCIAGSLSTFKDVALNVGLLLQDFPVVDEATTEIVKGKESAEGKKRQETKFMTRNRNKVGVPIIDQQDELLVTTTNGKCSPKTEIGTLQGVDSRSKFNVDNVSSLAIREIDDLPNDFYQFPQREVATCSQKILLVLDINGLLADIVMPPPKGRTSDIKMLGRAIFKRPYCDDFLNFCFDTFDVGIWSSRNKKLIDKVVDYLLGERKHKLLFCWDMSHTTVSNFKTLENKYKPLVCKGLRNLWEKRDPDLPWEKGDYTESNTLLIDDSPYKALLNPMHTAIFPHSFTYKDQHDNSIGPGGELRVYLQNLAKTDDVRKYVEEHPFGQSAITEKSSSWDFYSKVINSLSEYI